MGGGPSLTVPSLCESLGAIGVSVHLVAAYGKPLGDSKMLPDLHYVSLHQVRSLYSSTLGFLFSPFFFRTIAHLCRHLNIQIIHNHGLWLLHSHSAVKVSRQFGIPYIIQPRGTLEPWALSYHAWKKHLALRFYQRSDLENASLLVATSKMEASGIRRAGLKQPIAIIPNGIDLPRWIEGPILKKTIRNALFLSRLHPKKGLLNLVAAWKHARPEGWRMIVAGPNEGSHQAEVKNAIILAKLDNDFLFVGPVEGEAKEKLFREADLFILPTFSENFGLVVAEALSYGIPVITTRGAPWAGLERHSCGWWIDIGVEPLSDAIREATNLPSGVLREMGMRGRAYVEANFAWSDAAKQMLSVYEWILHKGPKPDCVIIR
jgi:glycosyltransferase involved in cell wall biosynthesis